MSEEKFYHPQ